MQNFTTFNKDSNRIRVIPFLNDSNYLNFNDSRLHSMLNQLMVMDDVWRILFKIDKNAAITRKDFRKNICSVLKRMISLTRFPSLKMGVYTPGGKEFYYYSHGIIQGRCAIPKWTYYNVIRFLEKAQILHIERKNIREVSSKKLSYRLFETLNFLSFLTAN